jgi:hypothetical protein
MFLENTEQTTKSYKTYHYTLERLSYRGACMHCARDFVWGEELIKGEILNILYLYLHMRTYR